MNKKDLLKLSKEEVRELYFKVQFKRENVDCFDCFDCFDCYKCYNCSNCSNCYKCYNCSTCYYCSNCYNCSYCTNQRGENKGYMLLDVQLTKEEYEAWKAKK